MPIEQDTRNATNPLPLLVLTGAVACIALILGALALWLHVNNRKLTLNQRTQVVEAEDGLSQAIRQRDLARQQAQQLFNIANDKQRFIDESFWHFARFLTNAHVREIELATGRVSTFVDTNELYGQAWKVTVTSSNIVAKKAQKP